MSKSDAGLSESLSFWGKLRRKDNGGHEWRPLLCHMIDVAAVTRAMWESVLSPAARRDITSALGLGDDQDGAGSWVAFLAGLHDLGKASPSFQFQVRWAAETVKERLREIGLRWPQVPRTRPHGTITAAVLPIILTQEFRVETHVADQLSAIVGGHHGTFPDTASVNGVRTAPPVTATGALSVGRWFYTWLMRSAYHRETRRKNWATPPP